MHWYLKVNLKNIFFYQFSSVIFVVVFDINNVKRPLFVREQMGSLIIIDYIFISVEFGSWFLSLHYFVYISGRNYEKHDFRPEITKIIVFSLRNKERTKIVIFSLFRYFEMKDISHYSCLGVWIRSNIDM